MCLSMEEKGLLQSRAGVHCFRRNGAGGETCVANICNLIREYADIDSI